MLCGIECARIKAFNAEKGFGFIVSEASAAFLMWLAGCLVLSGCPLLCFRCRERSLVGSLQQEGLYRHLATLCLNSQELASLGYLEDVFLLAKDAPRPTCEAEGREGREGGRSESRDAGTCSQAGHVVAFRAFLNSRGHPQAKAGPGHEKLELRLFGLVQDLELR